MIVYVFMAVDQNKGIWGSYNRRSIADLLGSHMGLFTATANLVIQKSMVGSGTCISKSISSLKIL